MHLNFALMKVPARPKHRVLGDYVYASSEYVSMWGCQRKHLSLYWYCWYKKWMNEVFRGGQPTVHSEGGLQLSLITVGLQSRGSPFFTSSWNCSAVPLIFLICWDTFKMGTSADPWRFLHNLDSSLLLHLACWACAPACEILYNSWGVKTERRQRYIESPKKGWRLRSVIYDSLLNYNLETLI